MWHVHIERAGEYVRYYRAADDSESVLIKIFDAVVFVDIDVDDNNDNGKLTTASATTMRGVLGSI